MHNAVRLAGIRRMLVKCDHVVAAACPRVNQSATPSVLLLTENLPTEVERLFCELFMRPVAVVTDTLDCDVASRQIVTKPTRSHRTRMSGALGQCITDRIKAPKKIVNNL